MGIFDGCLLASDVDGTLLENGYLNPVNVEKIEFFIKEGGAFSLSTGRSVGAVSDVLEKVKRISPSVVANGCMIYDYENEKTVCEKTLPDADKNIIKTILDMNFPLGIEIHMGIEVLTLSQTRETDLHQTYEKLQTVLATFEDVKDKKINKILLSFSSAEQKDEFKKLISNKEEFKNLNSNFIDTCAVIGGEKQNYYELVPKGISKASAIATLCEVLNIKKGGYFSIGDYYNDLEMIKAADISAAPITSPDDIKNEANYITVPCKDGAVADFINYLTSILSAK